MTTNAAPKNVNGHELVEIGLGTGALRPNILHCVVVPYKIRIMIKYKNNLCKGQKLQNLDKNVCVRLNNHFQSSEKQGIPSFT